MLSLGTEDFLAFWMASYSVGLPPGSPPPIRAATSMFLISLANILPRRASMTAFLCFVVAHLEWPDMALPLPTTTRLRAGPPAPRTTGGSGSRRPSRDGTTSPSAVPDGPRRSYLRLVLPRPRRAPGPLRP